MSNLLPAPLNITLMGSLADFSVDLKPETELAIVAKWAKTCPDAVRNLLERPAHVKGNCPFPEECNQFPCPDMTCNADCCSNGYTSRMS